MKNEVNEENEDKIWSYVEGKMGREAEIERSTFKIQRGQRNETYKQEKI